MELVTVILHNFRGYIRKHHTMVDAVVMEQ